MVGMIKRAGALVLLLAILVGFPALLVATIGNPWPPGGLDQVAMMDSTTILGLVAVLGWFVWAQLVACTLWEIPPALRRESAGATRLPIAAGSQQRLIRVLVHTVLAVGVGSTVVLGNSTMSRADDVSSSATQPVAHVAASSVETSPQTVSTSATAGDVAEAEKGEHPRIVTAKDDTFWDLAEKHLDDGFRWKEISDLNQGRVMPNGQVFNNPRILQPGWEILLPTDATNLPGGTAGGETVATEAGEAVVQPGGSLSEIADDRMGGAEQWPALYEANEDVIGPNPDLIQPGQVLVVPGDGATAHEAPEAGGPRQDAPSSRGGDQDPAPGVNAGEGKGSPRHDEAPETPDAAEDPAEEQDPAQAPAVPVPPVTQKPAVPTPAPSSQPGSREGGTQGGSSTTERPVTSTSASEADESGEISALRALLASAGCLAVGALALIANNRRRQFRRRRIGRTIASTPLELAEVEQAVLEEGSEAQEDVEFLDRALRYVAGSCRVAGVPLPQLGAAVLGSEDLTLLFSEPAEGAVPEGWSATEDNRAWMLPRWTYLEADLETQPAPYPALVSVGADESDRTWLLDLESLGVCGIAGDPAQVADLARFMAAELAVNAWSEGSEVLLADEFAAETVGLNPARLRQVDRSDALARAAMVSGEASVAEENLNADVLTRRRDDLLLDSTNPIVVVVPTHPTAEEGEFVSDLAGRTRSRVVLVYGGEDDAPAVELTGDGMVFLPQWGISVKAFTLPPAEAAAMAALLASTRNMADEPIPVPESDDGPLGAYARVDGSLREEYVEPRRVEGEDPTSLLPDADEVYLATAATTAEDMAAAAPSLSEEVRAEIEAIDPSLSQDLADWFDQSSPRPKIRLLGPVDVTALKGGDPSAIANAAGTVSFIAYLATKERGVTGEAAASAFGWKTVKTVQNRATNARFLLGHRPDGTDWLPDASQTEGARKGSPFYELVRGTGGVLVDIDLFTRLRFRAQKRGEGGEEDLVTALKLVEGAPFEAASERKFPWLFTGQRFDEIMVGAIHDVAHLLATRAVADGRTDLVKLACDTARKANPHSDVAWLDLAAAAEAESGRAAADDLVREQIVDRFDDEDLPPRTETILDQRDWLTGFLDRRDSMTG